MNYSTLIRVATPFLILFTAFVVFIVQLPVLFVIYIVFLSAFTMLEIVFKQMIPKPAFIIAIFLLPGLIVAHSASTYIYFIQSVSLVCLAAYLSSKYSLSDIETVVKAIYIVFSLYMFCGAYQFRNEEQPFQYILGESSTNGATSYLIVIQSCYSILYYKLNNKLPLYSSLSTFVLSYIGFGRGSLVASLFIVGVTVFVNTFNPKFILRSNINILVMIVACAIFFYFGADLFSYIESNTKLGNGLHDENRTIILESYINNLDFSGIFLGSSYDGTVIPIDFNNNPHIAYVRTHHFFGILSLFLVLLSPALFFFQKLTIKQASICAFLSMICLVRAVSEPILFPTLLDIFYIIPFFVKINEFS